MLPPEGALEEGSLTVTQRTIWSPQSPEAVAAPVTVTQYSAAVDTLRVRVVEAVGPWLVPLDQR